MRFCARITVVFFRPFFTHSSKRPETPTSTYVSNGILSVNQLNDLILAVSEGYQAFLSHSGYPRPSPPSVTLVSKILMGVMGVLPAFDTCFKSAIQALTLRPLKAAASPTSLIPLLSRHFSMWCKTQCPELSQNKTRRRD